jgi:hypothetical protein
VTLPSFYNVGVRPPAVVGSLVASAATVGVLPGVLPSVAVDEGDGVGESEATSVTKGAGLGLGVSGGEHISSFTSSELLEPLPDLPLFPEPLPDLPPFSQSEVIMDNPFPDLEPEPLLPLLPSMDDPFPDLEPEPLLPLLLLLMHNHSSHIS